MNIRTHAGVTPELAAGSYIDPAAVLIGDVVIGADSSVWPMAVLRGDLQAIRIGDRTNIQDNSVLHVTHDSRFFPQGFALTVGNDVTVGHSVVLHGCTVGDGCLIGMSSTVMDGAVIEPAAMLGAGSLVTPGQIVCSGELWLGSPARRLRDLTADELDYLKYASSHYVELKDRYLAEQDR